MWKSIVVLLLVACGHVEQCSQAQCHPGNWKIVQDRYQFCNELGTWEDGGAAP